MNRILLLLLFIIVTPLFAQQTEFNKELITKYTLDKKILIEDKNGHLITDSIARRSYFTKRQEKIDSYNLLISNTRKTSVVSDAVQMCTNGGFEEFETVSNVSVLKNFKYVSLYPTNPTQCKSIPATAPGYIKQYDPNDNNLTVSTVPSNFLDQYIGNINAFDQYALKINYKESTSTEAGIVQAKRFKSNNETQFKFNFKTVLQSITESDHINEQPYFKARILNKDNVVVSEFCVVGDPKDCIFTQANDLEGGSIILYTKNWQNGTLDISSIPNNEEFTVEFIGARCGLGGHFGYTYIDDICTLHTTENSQGSIELEPLNKVCPTLPISVCGNFTLPNSGGISATIDKITLNVYDQTGASIFTTSTTSSLDLANKRFCFNIKKTDLPNTTSGTYNVGVKISYGIVQTTCSGTSFNPASDDDANPGWDISFMNCTSSCNFTVATGNLEQCDANNDGKEIFNLSDVTTQVIGNQSGLTLSYYKNIDDATADTNKITNYTTYESSSASIYVRVTKSAGCYKVIAIQLTVKNPSANITGSLNICGGSTTLTATKGVSYLWSNGEKTQNISATSTGVYSVEVTYDSGCVSKASITIPANQIAPQPTITIKQPDCFTNTGTITITSAASECSFDGGNTWTTDMSMSNLSVGDYYIKVKTSSGCISYNTRVSINPFYLTYPNYTSVNPQTCNGFGSITITTVAYEYSFDDGATWVKNNTASNLPSGTYNIRTKNQFGCISNLNIVTLNSQYIQAPYFNVVQPKCNVGGTIKITTSAAEYSFDNGATWTTNSTATDLPPGAYNLMIKSVNGCLSYSQYVNLENYYLPSPLFTFVQPKCGKGGTIKITTAASEYSFDNGVTWTTNPVATDLDAGTYYLLIKNDVGCKSNYQYVTLNTYYLNYPSLTIVQPKCGVGGSITINTKATEYSFDNGTTWTTNPVATDLPPGYYLVMYKNDLGCISYTQYANLEQFYLPNPTVTTVQPVCGVGGSITITTPASKYSFDGGITWTTNATASNLAPGYYPIMYKNDLDCTSYNQYVVLNTFYLPNPKFEAVNPSCGNTGSITFTTVADQYSFDNGQTWTTNPVASNLASGYYYLKIKNNLGCESSYLPIYLDPFYLATPNIDLVQPTCNGKGSLTITTVADFYSFDNGATWTTNPVFANAEPNTYCYFLIKNKLGCTSSFQYAYFAPFYLDNPTFTIEQPTCEKGGTITITTVADQYSFDNGQTWTTNPVATNLTSGYYYILIKNNLGCTSNYQYAYLQPYYLDYPTFTTEQPTCDKGGIITITTPADQYSFDNGQTWTTNPVASNLSPGYYYVLIKNKLGCTSNYQNTYIQPFYLDNPDIETINPICGTGGTITITSPADFYSFDNGNTWTTNPVASNLPPGYYYVLVKSKLGCTSNTQYAYLPPFYLDNPTFEVVNPTCTDIASIKITTPADNYSFDNGQTWTKNPVLTNPNSTYYYLKIKNNQGCESNYQFVYINQAPYIAPKPAYSSIQPSNCGVKDGSITITSTGSSYSFDNGVTWQTSAKSGALEAGTYLVCIKEYEWGCPSAATTVVLNSKNSIIAPNFSTVQPTCTILTGKITIDSPASSYSFDNGISWQTTNFKANLLPNNYLVKTKDANGCISDAASVNITVFASFKIASTSSQQPVCSGELDTGIRIDINITALEYSFDNGVTWSTSSFATNLKSNTEYCLKIKNAQGCISEPTCITTVKQNEIPKAPALTVTQAVGCEKNGSIKVNDKKYQYSFDNGNTWTTNQTSGPLAPGDYFIRTKEIGTECISYATKAVINTPPDAPQTPEISVIQPTTCTNPFGSITITTLASQYSFDNGLKWSTNPSSGNLPVGNYMVKVKNAAGCESASVSTAINPSADSPQKPLAALLQPDCSNSKGNITVTTPATEFSFDNGNTWTTDAISSFLNPGDYFIKIKNSKGCISEASKVSLIPFTDFTSNPISSNSQLFCIQQNATISNVLIKGQDIKWYDAALEGNLLTDTTLLENRTYYATQTINNCESKRLAITIKIQDTKMPTGDSNQSFCVQQNATINNLKINGENIKWYTDIIAGINLSEATPLENGLIYYATQTLSTCESERVPVTVQILEATTVECINYVDELPFPKFFTPNNDGYNDTWSINFAYLAPDTGIRIFDRYGKFIKELNKNTAWDGTYIGEEEPASDYWFTVTRLNGTEYRGHFSLKR